MTAVPRRQSVSRESGRGTRSSGWRPFRAPGRSSRSGLKLVHDPDTGLSLKGGVYVRGRPEFFIRQVRVYFDRDLVADFTLTSAISANPIFRFPVRLPRPGMPRVVFANNEGRQWEVAEPVRLAG